MSILSKALLICVLMALFQKAVEVLLVALAVGWIYGAIVRPVETFTLLFLLTLAACIRANPGWSLIGFFLLAVVAVGVAAGKMGEPKS
ncbi:MAG: hypothetical protein ACI9KA_001071 [Parasphingorhabdus sp.]|jgi:hypothetical protein|uniref:hypothetical protein n=1 Tax=Parasphingorhabdus sp. TaxID=2709688 RepID=UPI0039E48F12